MKAIMISIKPQHLVNILNGKKTIEVRKSKAIASAVKKMMVEQGCAEIYVYCSKNEYLYRTNKGYIASNKPLRVGKGTEYTFAYSDEGKVVCSFKCYKEEEIFDYQIDGWGSGYEYATESMNEQELLGNLCLSYDELEEYLNDDGTLGYAIHISDIKIFDTPKELSEFKHERKFENTPISEIIRLTKAPQNMVYVEIPEYN